MASPMICATVMTTEPTPLMMEAMDGAAAVIVCKMTGTTVCVIKLNMLSMIGRTVVCEKVTSCPITPITDCRMVVMPPNAAPASSPNRLVMLSCSGLQCLGYAAVLEQSQQRVLKHRELFQPRVAEHPLYDFVQPAELVRQDAHHSDDAGDHTHNRQRPGQQTAEAARNRAIDAPQQTGPAAEYAPDSFSGTGVCDAAYHAASFPQQAGKSLLERCCPEW